jgi:hypothetical protein
VIIFILYYYRKISAPNLANTPGKPVVILWQNCGRVSIKNDTLCFHGKMKQEVKNIDGEKAGLYR